jgi:hypothetical protein
MPDAELPWDERLGALAASLRETGARYPDVFPLLLTRPVATAAALRVREVVYAGLRDGGVSEELVPRAERLLSTFVIGFAASEAGGRFAAHDRAARDADFEWGWRRVLTAVTAPLPRRSEGAER